MAKDFLHYYELEMQYIRDMCGEFAREFPKVAGRFAMDEFSCEDPYVERLLQGYSFLSAKAHQALDGGFPELSHALLNNLCPDFLVPIPSTGIVSLNANNKKDIPTEGLLLKRGTELKVSPTKAGTECYFQTVHDVQLWPIDIISAKYYPDDISELGLNRSSQAQSCLKLELKTANAASFKDFNMDCFEFYLSDSPITMQLYKMLLANCSQIILQSKDRKIKTNIYNPRNDLITPRGFDLEESLFPTDPQTFEGYRLFRKFFVLPQSFMFIQVNKIKHAIKEMNTENIDVIFVFNSENQNLKGKISKKSFDLFCSPVVNLFVEIFSSISLKNGSSNLDPFQKSSSKNLEILKILEVNGSAEGRSESETLTKLYSNSSLLDNGSPKKASYSLTCTPRSLTEEELEDDAEITYPGTNTYISIKDKNNKPYKGKLDQLKIIALCSNRNFPVAISSKRKNIHFETDSASTTMDQIKLIHGPTTPYCDHLLIPPWEIINHISLNFLTLNDETNRKTAETIKNILEMYAISEAQKEYIAGIRSVATTRKQQRFNNKGDFSFVNGLNIDLMFDEQKTNNYFLLGMIIDRFFMHATPVDTFIQTTVNTKKRGKIIQWPAKKGTKPLI